MRDSYNREINYMRISITDRCNLRCKYCMPNGVDLVSMDEVLTFEEIVQIVRAAVEIGIVNFKITGGEPLVRKGCSDLVRMIKSVSGVNQVTLTTNGVLLSEHLADLIDAGIDGINISLDTLDREKYQEITGFDELEKVLCAIDAAVDAGVKVKVNSVLQNTSIEENEEWKKLILLAKEKALDVRFIELMPIGSGKDNEGISNKDLIEKINKNYELVEDKEVHGNGPAVYYKPEGFAGCVGFISAIHGKYCNSCNRIRLTATGDLKPCLCYGDRISVKGIDDNDILVDKLRKAVEMKPACHNFEEAGGVTELNKMAQIGG